MADLSGVDLLSLIERDTKLKREASTKGGEWAGPCPLCGGKDRFRVWPNHPDGRGQWWCRKCGQGGDAIAYVRSRDGVGYREACELLGVDLDGGEGKKFPKKGAREERREPVKRALDPPTEAEGPGYDLEAALILVETCQKALWSDEGSRARAYLAGRGLQEKTIRGWGLGFNPEEREISGLWTARGIVIPCWVGYIPWGIKVRRATGEPKYIHVKGSKPALFGLDMLTSKQTAVVCEGELDAILLWQEAGDLVDVVAIGSKTASPAVPFLGRLIGASRWLLALDLDADKEAEKWGEWSARVQRVKPLQGNDITDFYKAGGDLRRWVLYHLEQVTAERLAAA